MSVCQSFNLFVNQLKIRRFQLPGKDESLPEHFRRPSPELSCLQRAPQAARQTSRSGKEIYKKKTFFILHFVSMEKKFMKKTLLDVTFCVNGKHIYKKTYFNITFCVNGKRIYK